MIIADYPYGLHVLVVSDLPSVIPPLNALSLSFFQVFMAFAHQYLHNNRALLMFYHDLLNIKRYVLGFLKNYKFKVFEEFYASNESNQSCQECRLFLFFYIALCLKTINLFSIQAPLNYCNIVMVVFVLLKSIFDLNSRNSEVYNCRQTSVSYLFHYMWSDSWSYCIPITRCCYFPTLLGVCGCPVIPSPPALSSFITFVFLYFIKHEIIFNIVFLLCGQPNSKPFSWLGLSPMLLHNNWHL